MKQFYSFIKKEFQQIFRDKRTLLILLVMPIVLVIILGYAINTELNDVRVAVFDPSKDEATRKITERFQASKYFSVTDVLSEKSAINEIFKEGNIDLVIVFPENFSAELQDGQAAIQLIADGTDPNKAYMLTGYAQGVLSSCQLELLKQYGIPVQIQTETRMLYNPQSKSAYNFVPGVMGLILTLISAMMTSVSIVREKEMGTMEVLLASPMKPFQIILSKMTPYFVLSITNLITILLLAVFVMGVPIRGSLFWLAVVSVLFIVVALSLGLLISTLVDKQMSSLLVSGIGLMMPVLVFSGLIFPIENIPVVLRWISDIIPARWYIEIVRKIMIEGVGVQFFIKELCIIVVMALVLITIAWKKFKVRLC